MKCRHHDEQTPKAPGSAGGSSTTDRPGTDQHPDRLPFTLQSDVKGPRSRFSGGKDSTASVQLLYCMLARLRCGTGVSPVKLKPVYVLASDTYVEAPYIAARIRKELETLQAAAERDSLPLTAHLVFPKLNDTFCVNLIGRGYPSPNTQFRWCTDRLNNYPVSNFIKSVVDRLTKAA